MQQERLLKQRAPWDRAQQIEWLYFQSLQITHETRFDDGATKLRYSALHQIAEQAIARAPHLTVVECGCRMGLATRIIAHLCLHTRNFEGVFHVFDAFEDTPESRLTAILAPFPLCRTHAGKIQSRFDVALASILSFVSIGTEDPAEVTASMSFMYPRLERGGTMYIDAYSAKHGGVQMAVDGFLKTIPTPSFFFIIPGGGAFLIK